MMAADVLVLNCGEIIPPIRVHPRASLDDGVLEVMALRADSAWGIFRGMGRAITNVLVDAGSTSYLYYGRGRRVVVEAFPPEMVQHDGDLVGMTPVTAEVCPGVLEVVAPAA